MDTLLTLRKTWWKVTQAVFGEIRPDCNNEGILKNGSQDWMATATSNVRFFLEHRVHMDI